MVPSVLPNFEKILIIKLKLLVTFTPTILFKFYNLWSRYSSEQIISSEKSNDKDWILRGKMKFNVLTQEVRACFLDVNTAWSGDRYSLLHLQRLVSAGPWRKYQIIVRERSPASLHFGCPKDLMLSVNHSALHVLVKLDLMMLRSLGRHPILGRILNWPSLLTRSKAFVRFMKARKSCCRCSLPHIYCSCQRENTVISILLAQKPHCDSG